jgi:hypothetical protein
MRKIIHIQPKSEEFNTLEIGNIVLTGTFARVMYVLSNTETEYSISHFIDITPEEYDQWGTDDNYHYDLVVSKLDAVKA